MEYGHHKRGQYGAKHEARLNGATLEWAVNGLNGAMHLNGEGWVVTIRFSQLLVGVCCVFVERRSCHG